MTTETPTLLSARAAAKILQVSHELFNTRIAPRLPQVKLHPDAHARFRQSDVEKLLEPIPPAVTDDNDV